MRTMHCVMAAWLLALAATAPAQDVAGTACGLDGRPTHGITLRAVDAGGRMLAEGVSADDGRFVLRAPRAVHSIVVRYDAVQQEVRVPAGAATDLVVTFAGAAHFTVTGRLRDPGGRIGSGVDIAARDAAGKVLAIVTTDADGRFAMRANQPLHDLVVDPLGWAHRVPGVLTADAERDLDLQQERSVFFRLQGRTLDAAGRAAAGVRVVARDEKRQVARTTSAADGTFTLWSTRPITHLFGHDGAPATARCGAWRTDAAVDLDEREHGYAVVRGRIVGKGAGRTAIFAATVRPQPPHRVVPDGASGQRGVFAVRVPRYQTHLWFFQESGNRQAWVKIVPGQDLEVQFDP